MTPWDPPTAPLRDEAPQPDTSSVWSGFGLVLLGHVLTAFIPFALFFLDFLQWIYVVPMAIQAKKRGFRNRARGIWVTASITLGLQLLGLATCNTWLRFH